MPDPLATDALARRLDALTITAPAFRVAGLQPSSAGRAGVRRNRGRRLGLAAAAAVAATLATGIVAFPQVLTAISRDVLGLAGLTPAQVSPLTGEARHGTTALSVSGAYADSVSTVVFATVTMYGTPCDMVSAADRTAGRCGDSISSKVDKAAPCKPDPELAGAPCVPAVDAGPYLTDQAGRRYAATGGLGVGVGAYPIFFQPVRPAPGGAHLTLHLPITHWRDATHSESFELTVVLSGALEPKVARHLAPPRPVVDTARGVTYEALDLTSSGTYLEVHTRLSGNLASVITTLSSSGMSGRAWPGVYLVDAAGHFEIPLAGGLGTPTITDTVQDETRIFSLAHPGSYRVVVVQDSNPGAAPGGSTSRVLAGWTVSIP